MKAQVEESAHTAIRADPTSERILDAALEQFAANGIRRTSMDDVAKAAQIARSGVYRYFGSKSELIQAALMRELGRYLAELETAIADMEVFADIAVEGFVVTLEFIRRSPILGELLLTDSDELLPYLTIRGGSIVKAATAFLVDRLRTATQSTADPQTQEELAETAVRLAISFVLHRDSCVDLDDDIAVRRYASRCVAPIAVLMTK